MNNNIQQLVAKGPLADFIGRRRIVLVAAIGSGVPFVIAALAMLLIGVRRGS